MSTILAAGGRVTDLLAVRQVLTTNNLLEAQLKQRIQQRMGDASRAIFATGSVFGVVLAGDDAADQRVWLPMG